LEKIRQDRKWHGGSGQTCKSCWRFFFFDIKGVVHHEFLCQGQRVNCWYYLKVLKHLRENVRRKRPQMWSGCTDPHFLDLGNSWRWVVSFSNCCFNPAEISPGTHWIGGWVDPRAGLDDVEKILDPTGIRTPTPQSSSPWPMLQFVSVQLARTIETACFLCTSHKKISS
jgi:hypothetical protein